MTSPRWPKARVWRLVAVCSAAGCYMGAASQAVVGIIDHRRWDWGLMAVSVLGYGLSFALLQVFIATGARNGRRPDDEDMSLALDLRALPKDADPSVWRPWLERRRRSLTWVGVGAAVLSLVMGVLVAWAAVAANDNSSAVWALAAAFVLFAAVPVAWARQRGKVADQLLVDIPNL